MSNTFTKHIYAALLGVAVLSSCSRPVAYFQRGPVQHHNTPITETVAVATPVEAVQPTEAVVAAPVAVEVAPVAVAPTTAPAVEVAQAKATMSQIEAYVRNDSKLATDKKLNKRMDRVKDMLASAETKSSLASNSTTTTKKANLLERMATKKIDKQIKNKLSPERTMAKSLLTIGLIVAVAGLILLLVGGSGLGALGGIALVVGLVLILIDLLR